MGYVTSVKWRQLHCNFVRIGLIQQTCPWFFEMRELIAEHPNVNPIGLGNSTTDIDMESYCNDWGKGSSGDVSDKMDIEMEMDELNKELDADESDEDECGEKPKNKRKAQFDKESSERTNGKTAARPGKSKPASRTLKEQRKKRKFEDFAEVAEAEELTRQKELELAKARMDKEKAKAEVKAAESAYKLQKLKDKMEQRKEKAEERAAKLRLLEYRQSQGFTMHTQPPPSPYYRHQVSSSPSPFQAFSSISTSPQHHPTVSSSHYFPSNSTPMNRTASTSYSAQMNQTASTSYSTGPSTPSYEDGHSNHEVSLPAFSMHGDDGGSSSSSIGPASSFSEELDLMFTPLASDLGARN